MTKVARPPIDRRRIAPLALLLLASCVGPQHRPAPPSAAPIQPMPTAPPTSSDWRDIARTPGAWRWSGTGGASAARYSDSAGAPLFSLRCDESGRQVVLERSGAAQGAAVLMAFTTSAGSFAYPGEGDGSRIIARAAAADPSLDRIAFSRGRFIVAVTGTARLALPAEPEVGRVIDDCRH